MEEEKKYISVAEYAEMFGISTQAVYKRMNTHLQPFVVVIAKKKYIDISALELEPQPATEQPCNQPNQPTNQPRNQPLQPILEQELAEKNKQIESLLRQIDVLTQQNSNLTELLRNSQVLLAAEKKILIEQPQSQEQPKKKGIFSRLFGKKENPA